MGMLGNFPYQGLISGDNISDASIGASDLKTGLLSGVKNRITNGDMEIAQRGSSFAAAASGTFPVDRFQYIRQESTAVNTLIQSTDVPAGSGLSNSLRATVTTADTSIAASDLVYITQRVEGYSTADLSGTPITLSFWVKSSKTGTHCVALRNYTYDNSYISEYTINSANTWEKKFITISAGLPSSGTWNYTNGVGLFVAWVMSCGSTYQTSNSNSWIGSNSMATNNQVNCLDTVGNIFAITGVQLEKGSSATDFEFRPYSTELAMCQRYYEIVSLGVTNGAVSAAGQIVGIRHPFKVTKRVNPTVTFIEGSDTAFPPGAALYIPSTDSVLAYKSATSANANANFYQTISASAEL